jgi:hypothetical protein
MLNTQSVELFCYNSVQANKHTTPQSTYFSYYSGNTHFVIVTNFSTSELKYRPTHRLLNCASVDIIKVLMCHEDQNERCKTLLVFKSLLVYLLKQMNVFERKLDRTILGPVYGNGKENWRILTLQHQN